MPGSACVLTRLGPALLALFSGGAARDWERGARWLGLAIVLSGSRGAARGVIEGHRLDVEWNGPALTLALHGPTLADPKRAEQVHARLASQLVLKTKAEPRVRDAAADDALASAVLQGLSRLVQSGDAVLFFSVRAARGGEQHMLASAVSVATWVGDALGWKSEDSMLLTAQSDPDPRVRLRAWEKMLGGFTPTGSLSTERHDLARMAIATREPLVAVLGALHLGEEGIPLLKERALDPESTDEIVGYALRGVWDALSPGELASLLAREGEEVVVRACLGLARVGRPADLPAIRAWEEDSGARGEMARRAIVAIRDRTPGGAGGVSLAQGRGGVSMASERKKTL